MIHSSVQTEAEHYLIIQDDRGRKEMVLTEEIYTIGRSPSCDIFLKSQFVSRYHATLLRRVKADQSVYYHIIDGDGKGQLSANGLLINHQKVLAHDLAPEDEIFFGHKVSATYYYRQRNEFITTPGNDPFDITLIDPMMMGDEDDSDATLMPTLRSPHQNPPL
ncbi:MAG: FHA domain-containing protein [Snowella sp.]|nr:FHA domain-containing protein [Snowella sp.]